VTKLNSIYISKPDIPSVLVEAILSRSRIFTLF